MNNSPDRVLITTSPQKLTRRLTKWVGVVHDFAGFLESPRWRGYKTVSKRGVMTVHLWGKA